MMLMYQIIVLIYLVRTQVSELIGKLRLIDLLLILTQGGLSNLILIYEAS